MKIFGSQNKFRVRFHPLTIIFLNILLPVFNTVFPSSKAVFFTILFALFMLLSSGCYKRALKTVFFLIIYFSLYILILRYLNAVLILSMFRMALIFLPCIILASLLVSQYNSSELLSALEMLCLPKIFVIGLIVTIRYIPTFKKEFRIIRDAMYIRGVRFSAFHPIRSFEYLLVPQLFRALSLSCELTSAGLVKGLSAPFRRTSYYARQIRFSDYLVIILFLSFYLLQLGRIV